VAVGFWFVNFSDGQQIRAPHIEWQRVYGNSENDFLYAVQQTRDGGYVLAGSSLPPADGTKTAQGFGGADFWVVRVEPTGPQVWDRCFGGLDFDSAKSLQETSDGGFIIGGGSWSTNSGNKTSLHYGTAVNDFWVLRLDASGNKIWERDYGGSYDDPLRQVAQTADGGFFLCGGSASPISGNKTAPNYGSGDYWVVRVNANGEHVWDQSYGGNNRDLAWCAALTRDGGLVLGGGSISAASATKTSTNYGDFDFWLVRTDASGRQLWDRTYGGIYDDTMYSVAETPDGGFVMAGRSFSPPGGNKTSPNHGNADYWVVRTDAGGNKLWDQSFGGTSDDLPTALAATADGGVVIGGRAFSGIEGTKTSTNFGSGDYWVIRLDSDGTKLWEATYGGSQTDGLESLQQTRDGGFILGGHSYSPADGNKTEPRFFAWSDFWVIKLGPEQPFLEFSDPPLGPNGPTLTLAGIKNLTYTIEWSSNLTNWTILQTQTMTNSLLQFTDGTTSNSTHRFYRVRQER
jgi:hypothetical protein